jgi:hypothetical protein
MKTTIFEPLYFVRCEGVDSYDYLTICTSLSNALKPISVLGFGISIFFNLLYIKANIQIILTLLHIVTLSNLLFSNAFVQIDVTEFGITIFVKLLFLKALCQIVVIESGITTCVIQLSKNALSQIVVIESGILVIFLFAQP